MVTIRMPPADIASWFCIRSFFGPRTRKYAGTGVPHIVATLRTIGAAIATAASASDRDQPPTPRLSIGMFSTVQPIRTPPTNAFALTASHSDGGLPDPERVIGNGLRAREFRRACSGGEESPMSPHRPFECTLPGLVECLDDIHVELFALAQRKHVLDDTGLVSRRREGTLAHATRAGPADFANQHLFARKGGNDRTTNGFDVRHRCTGGDREILPIREDMN